MGSASKNTMSTRRSRAEEDLDSFKGKQNGWPSQSLAGDQTCQQNLTKA